MKKLGFVWIFIALMLSAAVVSAQGWRYGRSAGNNSGNRQGMCINLLADLTTEQKEKISQLVNAHQEAMDELRTEQRTTIDPVKKTEIREEMLQKVQAHKNEVKNLLTDEQQTQYGMLQTTQGNRGRSFAAGRGGFRGRGGFCRPGFRGGK